MIDIDNEPAPSTSVNFSTDIRAMSHLARHALLHIPHSQWRRHGIGLLQAYVSEGGPFETRIHIWHPDLVRPDIRNRGDIHTHRFTLQSTILVGSLKHIVYEPEASPPPEGHREFAEYTCVHARKDIGARYQPTGNSVWFKSHRVWHIGAGQKYVFERGAIHQSIARELCVSVVTKHSQTNERALIYARADEEPVHAFEPDDDTDPLPYILEAQRALVAHS